MAVHFQARVTVSSDTERSEADSRAGDRLERDAAALRDKYKDYCSALLADVFIQLTEERWWELAEEAARAQGVERRSLGFADLARLASDRLQEMVPLPDPEKWCRDYEAHPERFEVYLMGLSHGISEGDPPAGGG